MKRILIAATVLAATLTACGHDNDSARKNSDKDGVSAAHEKVLEFTKNMNEGTWMGSCDESQKQVTDKALSGSQHFGSSRNSRIEVNFAGEYMMINKVEYTSIGCTGDVKRSDLVGMFIYEVIEAGIISLYDVETIPSGRNDTLTVKGFAQGRINAEISENVLKLSAKQSPRSLGPVELLSAIGSEFTRE